MDPSSRSCLSATRYSPSISHRVGSTHRGRRSLAARNSPLYIVRVSGSRPAPARTRGAQRCCSESLRWSESQGSRGSCGDSVVRTCERESEPYRLEPKRQHALEYIGSAVGDGKVVSEPSEDGGERKRRRAGDGGEKRYPKFWLEQCCFLSARCITGSARGPKLAASSQDGETSPIQLSKAAIS